MADNCENCGKEIHPEVVSTEKTFGALDTEVEVYDKNHIVIQTVANQYGHTVWYDNDTDDFFPGSYPVETFTLSLNEEMTEALIGQLQAALVESKAAVDNAPEIEHIHAVPPVGERN